MFLNQFKRFVLPCAFAVGLSVNSFASEQKSSSSDSVRSTNAMSCEDIGAVSTMKQVVLDIGSFFAIGEPQKFCVLSKPDYGISVILATSLLSRNPNLASTAYRTGPNPRAFNLPSVQDVQPTDPSGVRADVAYCRALAGTSQFGGGSGLNGGWVNAEGDGMSGLCVFADGSMVSTWTLYYKRSGTTTRADFDAYFQNPVIPRKLW